MVKKAKDKRFLFFLFLSMKLLFIFFGLFDVCVKQCCPTINRNFILLSYSKNKKKSRKGVFTFTGSQGVGPTILSLPVGSPLMIMSMH